MNTNELGCRSKIEQFLIDYVHDIDDDNLESWPGYFVNDAIYQIIPRQSYENRLPIGILYCEGKGMMVDRINALRTANIFEPHTYCHMLGGSSIEAQANGSYLVRTNFSVIRTKQNGEMDIYAAGKYIDVVILDNGNPLLLDRRVVLESHRIDILLVVPI